MGHEKAKSDRENKKKFGNGFGPVKNNWEPKFNISNNAAIEAVANKAFVCTRRVCTSAKVGDGRSNEILSNGETETVNKNRAFESTTHKQRQIPTQLHLWTMNYTALSKLDNVLALNVLAFLPQNEPQVANCN